MPAPWLALGVVFLLGFRIALNVTDSNVIDVGYAGVIGAQRIVDGKPLYGGYPADNEHGDTYGPVNYEAYVPFEQIFGWSGTWDDLPAAHAAAIFFDLLATALLFLLGRRMRGPTLGVALAYAWVSYPFTLFALESNSNDTLVAVLVLAARAGRELPLAARHGRPRRARRAGRPDQVRAARARAAARHPRPVRALAARGALARSRCTLAAFLGTAALVSHPGAHPRLAAHDLRAHDRLPVQSRLAVLGLGAVRAARPRARRRDRRRRARARAGGRSPPRPIWSAWRRPARR